jgi:hypothetical protein
MGGRIVAAITGRREWMAPVKTTRGDLASSETSSTETPI